MWPPGIQCQICHMTFNDQSAINAHYDATHALNSSGKREHPDARHECDVCARKFVYKCDLKRHLSTVHGVGNVTTFKCEVCSKVFNLKFNLTKHLRRVHKTYM